MFQVSTSPCCRSLSTFRYNCILVSIASVFFFSGWWILISLVVEFRHNMDNNYVLPGIFGTVALIVVNLVPPGMVNHPSLYGNTCGSFVIKLFLLIGFMIAFGSLIGACYILFNDYILKREEPLKWPGYGIFLQNLFIFAATVALRFRKTDDLIF